MVKFITLAGKKQVGKDTSANMIKKLIQPGWTHDQVRSDPEGYCTLQDNIHIVHFADALKKACSLIFGISLEDMETEAGKQKLTSVRWPQPVYDGEMNDYPLGYMPYEQFFKTTGCIVTDSEFMTVREVLQFVGTDLLRNQMNADIWVESVFNQQWKDDDIVIIADARFPNEAEFAREYGVLIGVERDTGLKSDGHVSETALDDYAHFNHLVDNNGSFDSLMNQLEIILTAEGII
jgi:hypothetical protein